MATVALVRRFVGSKVTISTSDFHYVVGRLMDVLPDDRLHLAVGQQTVYVRREAVARILPADPALAEYVK